MIKKWFPAFGTINSISIPDNYNPSLLESIKKRMMQIHNCFSFFNPESEISQINQKAGVRPVTVSEDTFYLLSLALDYAKETMGVFNVAAGSLSELWKNAIRLSSLPSKAEIANCRVHCDIKKVELDKVHNTVFMREKGMKLDLGGIVKGYAVDVARSLLQSQGVQNAQINFGGTVAVVGRTEKIGVQNPFKKTGSSMASIILKNKAIVTSGSYEQYFSHQGKHFHHIIDPRTGMPSCSDLVSVSLIGDNAVMLDALATGIFCLGQKEGMSIVHKYGISAIFVTDNGSVQITPELQRLISFHS